MKNQKLIKTAENLDTLVKVCRGILSAVGIVCLIFAVLVLILGDKMYDTISFSIDLDFLKLHLAERIPLDEGALDLYLILNLFMVFALTVAVCYGLKQCRKILAPMKEGRPFAETVPVCLRKLALTVLIGGAAVELCGIAERMILAHACSVEQLFHPERVVLVEEVYTMDFSFVLVFCIIQFLSYIFAYGQELQKESDETL